MRGTLLALLCAILFAQGREILLRDKKLCTCNPNDSHEICATKGLQEIFIAHERCDKFYRCAQGKPVASCCARGLVFNIDKEVCDWPSNVQCGNRTSVPDAENDCLGNNSNEDNATEGDSDNSVSTCNCNPSEAPEICRRSGSELELYVAHEYCNHYYVCNHGIPVAMKCAQGLLYNPYIERCDWANAIECGDRIIPADEDSANGDGESSAINPGTGNCDPAEAPAICASASSDGILVAHESCNHFYICQHGKPVAVSCPQNLLYNPYTTQCDWPSNVDCGNRIDPNCNCEENDGCNENNSDGSSGGTGNDSEASDGDSSPGSGGGSTCNCDPSEAPTICAQQGSNGVLVAHENCNQFYKCSYGQPVAMCCLSGLLYNPYNGQCDWPHNVDCGNRVIPDGTECVVGGGGDDSGSGGGGGDSGSGGGSGDSGSGGGGGEGSSCNCDPNEAPTICAQQGSNGVLVAHENCNQFYKCSYGQPVAMCCLSGLLYNPYNGQCDWPHNVDCGNRVIPDGTECVVGGGGDDSGSGGGGGDSGSGGGSGDSGSGGGGGEESSCNCDPNEAPTICAQQGSNGVLVAHENCNQFYKCSYGQPVAMCCLSGLLYNPYNGQCDWPYNVDCGNRVIPDGTECVVGGGGDDSGSGGGGGDSGSGGGSGDSGSGDGGGEGSTCNCDPNEAPTICAQQGSNGVLVAHENCNQFYKCSYGQPVAMCCLSGLLYNPYNGQCDWPYNVDCGNRVIPDGTECVVGGGGDDSGSGGGGGDSGSGGGSGDSGSGGGGGEGSTCNCDPNEAPTICAQQGSNGVLVAHENCNQFYKCSYGQPVAMCCLSGLLYNPYNGQCDWPHNVDCGNRVIPDGTECVVGGGGDDSGSGGGGGDSGSGGGSGDSGSGDGGGEGSSCNCDPNEAPTICAQQGSNGVLVAHENCNQFYKCSYGQPVAMCCLSGLLYNPYNGQCDWPYNVDCGNRVIPDGTECVVGGGGDDSGSGGGGGDSGSGGGSGDSGSGGGGGEGSTCNCDPNEAPTICAQQGSNGVLVAHENCNQFYKCSYGQPVAMCCLSGLLYNPYNGQCDWPHNVDCGNRVIPDGTECVVGGGGDDSGSGGGGGDSGSGGGSGDSGSGDGGGEGSSCNCDPNEAPTICAQQGSNGVLVAHENCNQFYKCSYGQPVAMCCLSGLLYNPYNGQCDWPYNVDCGNRVIPDGTECVVGGGGDDSGSGGGVGDSGSGGGSGDSGSGGGGGEGSTCNCDPNEAPTICAQQGSNGVLVAHENCNQFYKCSYGQPVAMCCLSGLLYNPYNGQCDWPHNVDCGNRVIPDGTECVVGGGGDDSGSGGGGGDSGSGGGSGDSGSGGGGGEGSTCNCDPNEAPTICAQQGSNGVLVAHENCNQFYKCSYGQPVAMCCLSGLLYNPYNGQCDWPHNVDCGNRVIPDGTECVVGGGGDDSGSGGGGGDSGSGGGSGDSGSGGGGGEGSTCNCDPNEAPTICVQQGSNGVLVAHENCNQFYKCSYGQPVAMCCLSGLLYNPYNGQCDWPHNVDCGNRVIPDGTECVVGGGGDDSGSGGGGGDSGSGGGSGDSGSGGGGGEGSTCNCDPNEAPTICAQQGSNGVLVAHENCNQFYKCSYGQPVAMCCLSGLLYNPYNGQCDWPHNVDCGNRVIPDGTECVVGGGGDDSGSGGGGGDSGSGGGSGDSGSGGGGGEGSTCNCDPNEAPTICVQQGSNGVLVAHENCNQFYKCSYGQPVAMCCLSGLLYNPYNGQCDWPHNVDCGNRVIPDGTECVVGGGGDDSGSGGGGGDSGSGGGSGDSGSGGGGGEGSTCNCDPNEAPTICAQQGSNGVLVAHENCNQFYKCSYGQPVAMCCLSGLLYNPYNGQCDWPHNVDCGNRVIPDGTECIVGGGGDDSGSGGGGGDSGSGGGSGDSGSGGGGGEGSTCNCDPNEAPTICVQQGSNGVLVAHENCNQFYKCSYGQPVAMCCLSGLLYNPYNGQCDWPHNVDCGNRVIPDGTECIVGGGGDDSGSGGGGGDSGSGGGSGDSGSGGGGGEGSTCNCDPSEAPTICAQQGSNGVLVAHENCNQFYKCSYGQAATLYCPAGLLYNPYIEQCDWPQNVNCGDRIILDKTKEEDDKNSEGDSGSGADSGDNGSGGESEDNDCNTEVVASENDECNCNPNEATNICTTSGSDKTLIAHANCNQFYKCNNGVPIPLKCPGVLLYNPHIQGCDWPHIVDCGDRVVPDDNAFEEDNNDNRPSDGNNSSDNDVCNCDPSKAPAVCAAYASQGILVAHENCNQFYQCSYGIPIAHTCSPALLYNPYTQQCDWSSNVECGNRVIPTENGENDSNNEQDSGGEDDGHGKDDYINDGFYDDPSLAPEICAALNSKGVLVAHEDCDKFYMCSGGIPVTLTCPTNLLFNPAMGTCDWAKNVVCGDRVVPDMNVNDNDCHCTFREAAALCAKPGSEGMQIAHENCNQFYVCVHGSTVAHACPHNLFYNPSKEVCDWLAFVDCGHRTVTSSFTSLNKHLRAL